MSESPVLEGSTPDDPPQGSGGAGQRFGLLIASGSLVVVLIAGVVLAVAVASGRGFQPDEVEHLHAAYELRAGQMIYRDFYQPHNPMLHLVLRPWIDIEDAPGSYRRGRLIALLAVFATLVLVAWLGWRLAGAEAAVLAAGFLILHTTYLERGMEVRPDVWLGLAALAALGVELSRFDRLRRSLLQGLILSIAFLFSKKIVFVCVFFGLVWLKSAYRERRWQNVVLPFVVWLVPVGIFLLALQMLGALEAYLDTNVYRAAASVSRTAAHRATFTPGSHLIKEGMRNPVFSLAVLVAFGALFAMVPTVFTRLRQERALPRWADSIRRRPILVTGLLALALVATLWANPFPFPYLHVTVLPVLALFAAAILAILMRGATRRWTALRWWIVLVLLLVSLGTATTRALVVLEHNQDAILASQQLVHAVTRPDDAVFDMAGLPFRPIASNPWLMTTPIFKSYMAGLYPRMIEQWREREMVAFVFSYRIRWLNGAENEFLRRNFIHFDRNVFIHGTRFALAEGSTHEFEVLSEREFVFGGEGLLEVDGQPFTAGVLSKGVHRLTGGEGGATGFLRMVTVPPLPQPPTAPTRLYVLFE